MIIDLERIALARREQQLADPRILGRRDQDEPERLRPTCVACAGPLAARHSNTKLCAACRQAGCMASPCPRCGGVRHMRDRNAAPGRKGLCGKCRAALNAEEGLA